MDSWVRRVRNGDFRSIPVFRWDESAEIAHVFDGYEVAGGIDECAAIGEKVREDWRNRFDASTALDLWIALFWNHRGYRHSGGEPSGGDLVYLDTLCVALRDKLQRLSEDQKSILLGQIGDHLLPKSMSGAKD